MNVKVVGGAGAVVLVEWQDEGLHRAWLPAREVIGGECAAPELGAPYGLPWAELLEPRVTPEALEQALYAAGLWTEKDVLAANPNKLLGVLQHVYGTDVSAIIEAARSVLRQGAKSNGR